MVSRRARAICLSADHRLDPEMRHGHKAAVVGDTANGGGGGGGGSRMPECPTIPIPSTGCG